MTAFTAWTSNQGKLAVLCSTVLHHRRRKLNRICRGITDQEVSEFSKLIQIQACAMLKEVKFVFVFLRLL